ncbi:uncharacterized protein LOC120214367 [Hibiscus syriacus]|uniref:uncharacterized protein LOC120214367 n=1 Tax=Hibiscus syriacus TaxID=106335 RepID=UPI0019218FAD|nr:uncharacterized protein LOC120214367 [Hibiscus syriacus]
MERIGFNWRGNVWLGIAPFRECGPVKSHSEFSKCYLTCPPIVLSLFRLPASVYKKLNGLFSRFLWGGSKDKKNIHWVRWAEVCKRVDYDGLGFVDTRQKNLGFLGKWCWRFCNEKSTPWKLVTTGTEEIWASLIYFKSKWETGEKGPISDFGIKVGVGWRWNILLRREVFYWKRLQWEGLLRLLESFASSASRSDWVKWLGSTDGVYSVKLASNLAFDREQIGFNWRGNGWLGIGPFRVEAFYREQIGFNWRGDVWLGIGPFRVEAFLWRALPLRVAVQDDRCPICSDLPESFDHFLQVWCEALPPIPPYK